jgi:hypothetical protein
VAAPNVARGDGVFETTETPGALTVDVADGSTGGTTTVDVAGLGESAGVGLGADAGTSAVLKLGMVAVAGNSVAPNP